jgi:hypothetical protein
MGMEVCCEALLFDMSQYFLTQMNSIIGHTDVYAELRHLAHQIVEVEAQITSNMAKIERALLPKVETALRRAHSIAI